MSYNTSIKQPIDQACAGQPSWHGAPPALVSSGKLRHGEEVISTLCLASMLFTRTIVCSSPFLPLSFLAKYRRALKKGPRHQSHSYIKKMKNKKKNLFSRTFITSRRVIETLREMVLTVKLKK